MRKLSLLTVALLISAQGFGAVVAVIDSGIDYKHQDIKSKMWRNQSSPVKTVTSAGRSYADDVNGWNFADGNATIIDYRFLGTFSDDCIKMYQIQARLASGTATDEDKDWVKEKRKDLGFLRQLSSFGRFVHGTHVAGISSRYFGTSQVIALKILPTGTPGTFSELRHGAGWGLEDEEEAELAKRTLARVAAQRSGSLEEVGEYLAAVKADVANGSFGTSTEAVLPVIKNGLQQMWDREVSKEEAEEYAEFFLQEIVKANKAFVEASPETLFVFAAGNDGTDNDVKSVSPANVKTDNTIAVAATFGVNSLAKFSNFGVRMVEVAAPGVAVDSTIPGDAYLPMSGTSMAAPYVTAAAAGVKEANPELGPAEIKQVLMQTVDRKPFLLGKVTTGGIVNRERAVRAAELTRNLSFGNAIAKAMHDIRPSEELGGWGVRGSDEDLIVLPLPSFF